MQCYDMMRSDKARIECEARLIQASRQVFMIIRCGDGGGAVKTWTDLAVFALFAAVTSRRVLSLSSSLLLYTGYSHNCHHVLVAAGPRRSCRLSVSQHLYIDLRSRQPRIISCLPDSSFAPTPTLVKQGFMPAQR